MAYIRTRVQNLGAFRRPVRKTCLSSLIIDSNIIHIIIIGIIRMSVSTEELPKHTSTSSFLPGDGLVVPGSCRLCKTTTKQGRHWLRWPTTANQGPRDKTPVSRLLSKCVDLSSPR